MSSEELSENKAGTFVSGPGSFIMSSDLKELRPTMPCGFAAATGAQLTFTEVKSRPRDAIPIDKLSEDQKRKLAIDCWNHGYWEDLFIGDRHITKPEAIEAVREGSELGKNLVQITMTGYDHIYKSFLQHDEEKCPLVKKLISEPRIDSPEPSSEVTIVSEAARSVKIPSTFTIYNHLSVTVYIYRLNASRHIATYFGDIPARIPARIPGKSSPVSEAKPDFTGQWWEARASKHQDFSILGHYVAYPGCSTWDIVSFPTDSFLPSAWNSDLDQPWNVCITNNLKTYVCIWQVMPNGSLNFVGVLNSRFSTDQAIFKISCGPCYIGTSLIATQGNTVISKFFVDSTECTTWSLDIGTPPGGEEIYATGDNNYIFYQVNTPQDDTVTIVAKKYSKQITISSNVTYLYASLFDSCSAYFAAPEDVKVTIESRDTPSGSPTHYDKNTITDSLYIQMTTNGERLQNLCVKNPAPGVWTIAIQAKTNTPVYFQFQTVPTAAPYGTMQATLSSSSMLGSNWEDIAYAGYASIANNIANNQMFDVETDIGIFPQLFADLTLGMEVVASLPTFGCFQKTVQNDQKIVKNVIDTVKNAAVPTPLDLHSILLVDADGADAGTHFIFQGRKRYIYPIVETGAFRQDYSKLVGKHEAIEEKFLSKLNDSKLKLVSIAGHGNYDRVCGYTVSGISPYTPILLATDVTEELATGKIFHFLACNTAKELGQTLVKNKAVAFIGYNKPFEASSPYKWMLQPDCTVEQELINGKTVEQAVEHAKAEYKKLMNKANDSGKPLIVIGKLKRDCEALVVLGNGNAMLVQASNQDEQQQSTSQDEQDSEEHNQTASS